MKKEMYADVLFLSTINPPRSFNNLDSLKRCANYIEEELKKCSQRTERQKFLAGGNEYENVIASFGPEHGERIIVGAHYDVAGELPGADDNASAVAGLLQLARMFKVQKPELKYRFDFVAYCLEEPPFFGSKEMGSYAHAEKMHLEKVDVKLMVCLEMIGYYSDEPGSQNFPHPALARYYPDTGNFIAVVGQEKQAEVIDKFHALMSKDAKIDVQKIAAPISMGYIGLSDHSCYWHFGYPALMINDTSMLRNPNYHEPTDTIETLDFDKMEWVVNGVYNALINY
jgi:Zn-dependent M28 family amino/carboxypeptidase